MAERNERYDLRKPPAMCRECGAQVRDFDIHDGFHNWLRTVADNAREGATAAYRSGWSWTD